jgi:hypothetical protein
MSFRTLRVLPVRLSIRYLIVHANHLSAAPCLQDSLKGKTGIGEKIVNVQESFGKAFNAGTNFARDGSQFDRLFKEGDTFQIGKMEPPFVQVNMRADEPVLIGDLL